MKRYEELGKRTVKVLEMTRKQVDKYGKERKVLDMFLREPKEDDEFIKKWEEYLKQFELELNVN